MMTPSSFTGTVVSGDTESEVDLLIDLHTPSTKGVQERVWQGEYLSAGSANSVYP